MRTDIYKRWIIYWNYLGYQCLEPGVENTTYHAWIIPERQVLVVGEN